MDENLSHVDENEDDNQLLLIITHLETHGLPVGNGIYKEVKEKIKPNVVMMMIRRR